MYHYRRFTLIELLVVIAIIAVLAAMLLPALGRAKSQARIALCASNQHQAAIAYVMYADESNEQLPYGVRYAGGGATIEQGAVNMMRVEVVDRLAEYGAFPVLACPNVPILEPVYVASYNSYRLGYANLAGHDLPPAADWQSPQTLRDDSGLALLTDQSYRHASIWNTTVVHRTFGQAGIDIDARLVGLDGQNVAYLDTSVRWVPKGQLREHQTYYNLGSPSVWVGGVHRFDYYF